MGKRPVQGWAQRKPLEFVAEHLARPGNVLEVRVVAAVKKIGVMEQTYSPGRRSSVGCGSTTRSGDKRSSTFEVFLAVID